MTQGFLWMRHYVEVPEAPKPGKVKARVGARIWRTTSLEDFGFICSLSMCAFVQVFINVIPLDTINKYKRKMFTTSRYMACVARSRKAVEHGVSLLDSTYLYVSFRREYLNLHIQMLVWSRVACLPNIFEPCCSAASIGVTGCCPEEGAVTRQEGRPKLPLHPLLTQEGDTKSIQRELSFPATRASCVVTNHPERISFCPCRGNLDSDMMES